MARPVHIGVSKAGAVSQDSRGGPAGNTTTAEKAPRRRRSRRRAARILAVSYLVKTLLVGVAWLTIPDFTERAMQTARAAWARMASIVD